jgi:MarR family transcriptional regulator, organic hydroperoxide resistance regulator
VISDSGASSRPSALLALQRATHASLQLITAELVDLDLTASEINALANLAGGAGHTVSQLAAAVGARPTTLTGILDRLERRGHITRANPPGDRRAVLISLTPLGQATAQQIVTSLDALERRALGGLDGAAVDGFHEVVRALTEASR